MTTIDPATFPMFGARYVGLAELEADTHLHIHKGNDLLVRGVVLVESELAAASRPT
jgi:hypothetical protein